MAFAEFQIQAYQSVSGFLMRKIRVAAEFAEFVSNQRVRKIQVNRRVVIFSSWDGGTETPQTPQHLAKSLVHAETLSLAVEPNSARFADLRRHDWP